MLENTLDLLNIYDVVTSIVTVYDTDVGNPISSHLLMTNDSKDIEKSDSVSISINIIYDTDVEKPIISHLLIKIVCNHWKEGSTEVEKISILDFT